MRRLFLPGLVMIATTGDPSAAQEATQSQTLQTTQRAANPSPYYVHLNSGRAVTRFFFNLAPP
ncbi:hypothetical protein SAMN05519103_08491 [Rhizobiales bacterium GAS113]|nr:hypothetical protein SAMN05519103_08491 [Rhizobiales bacterium GAS113]